MTGTSSTRPLLTESTDRQSQPEHATTAQSSKPTRRTTEQITAHLGITISWPHKAGKTERMLMILGSTGSELGKVV
jgi:hypothetical protein